jgi:hypothetical protein
MAAINVHVKEIQFVSSWVIKLFDKNYIPAQRDFLLCNISKYSIVNHFLFFPVIYNE